MAKWTSYTLGYKAGVILLLLGTVLYLIGFAAPYWIYREGGNGSWYVHSGLWLSCTKSRSTDESCFTPSLLKVVPYIAIKFTQTIGLLGLAASCLYALALSCTHYDKNRRLPDLLSAVSGLSGFIGCMIYVGEFEKMLRESGASRPYSWALGLNLAACILTMLNAILLSLCNKPATNTPASTVQGGIILARPSPAGYPAAAPLAQAGYPQPQGDSG